jgi:pimeloyl-ACP methyl ester carboxylesterase
MASSSLRRWPIEVRCSVRLAPTRALNPPLIIAEINTVDAIVETAVPNDAGANRPPNPPFIRSGHLTAAGFSDHQIYWEEYGSLAGEPVMVMHGGPGAGSHGSATRFFDPQRYRVILFDQRGCGKSTPSASEDDATAALTDNTTRHLIDDVSALRDELHIDGKMHVFGGSWGSTLALAYAIAHPATVQTLILRGIFLCRRADVNYFFQGNAAEFAADPLAIPVPAPIWISRRRGGTSSTPYRRKIAAMSSRGWPRYLPCRHGPRRNVGAW